MLELQSACAPAANPAKFAFWLFFTNSSHYKANSRRMAQRCAAESARACGCNAGRSERINIFRAGGGQLPGSPFMVARFGVGAILFTGICWAQAAGAGGKPFTRLDPKAFQSFVVNWAEAEQPLCRAILSPGDWDRWLKPAATMGPHRPFAPPAQLWNSHAVLLVARVINAGDTNNVFSTPRMKGDERELALDYRFVPNPPASSTMKWYLALEIAKPLPPTIVVRENGKKVCTLHPASAPPVSAASR